uniref:Uncharacterized protein n=1 Tax=Clytia hemisphaerica TaxID=252671 RepID=A0A7M5WRC4_9CNID
MAESLRNGQTFDDNEAHETSPGKDEEKKKTGRAKNLNSGPVLKKCKSCQKGSPPGCKMCKHCSTPFDERSKTVRDMMPKYKTNITTQTKQTRADIYTLRRDHHQEVVCLTIKENNGRYKVDALTTKGWASSFWSHHEEKGAPAYLLKRCLEKAITTDPPLKDNEVEFLVQLDAGVEDSQNEVEKENTDPVQSKTNSQTIAMAKVNEVNLQQHQQSKTGCRNNINKNAAQEISNTSKSYEIFIKDIGALQPLDVVATYSDDGFWLFLFEKIATIDDPIDERPSKRQKQNKDQEANYIHGYWFEEVETNTYRRLGKRVNVRDTTLVRFGVDLGNIFVLTKHNLNNKYYAITDKLKESILREIS